MLSTLLLSYFLGLCFASEVVLPQALVNVSDLLNTSIKEAALRTNTSVDVRPRLTRREAVNAQVPSALLKDGLLNTANATAKRIAVRFDAQGGFASTAFSKQAEGVKLAVKRGNESAPHQGHMLAKEPAQSAQPPQQLLQEPQQLQQQVSLKAQQLQQLQSELQELQKRQDMERMQQEPPVEHSQQPESGPGQLQQPPAELSQVVGGSKQAIGSGGALNATEQLAQPQPQQHVQDLLEQQSPLSPFFLNIRTRPTIPLSLATPTPTTVEAIAALETLRQGATFTELWHKPHHQWEKWSIKVTLAPIGRILVIQSCLFKVQRSKRL